MSLEKYQEFHEIVKDILENDSFQALDQELHHGISRYMHSVRVAKMTYQVAKKLNWDYEKVTRAALLHDFFFNSQMEECNAAQAWYRHPEIALSNSLKYFELDEVQKNTVVSHMFPSCKVMPKYKEGWLLTFVDKWIAFYEMYRFKTSLVLGIWTIFLFNMISLQK